MTRDNLKAITAYCPACDTRIRFGEGLRIGDIVRCPECEELLEVVRLSPVKLGWAEDRSSEDEEVKSAHDTS